MEHSLEDALLILDKWKNESTVIGVLTFVVNLEIKLMGIVASADRDSVNIRCGENSGLVINLKDCQFQYGDPREFPELPVPSSGYAYESFLVIQYPPKEIVMMFEPPSGENY